MKGPDLGVRNWREMTSRKLRANTFENPPPERFAALKARESLDRNKNFCSILPLLGLVLACRRP